MVDSEGINVEAIIDKDQQQVDSMTYLIELSLQDVRDGRAIDAKTLLEQRLACRT
ncbi:hypothetical protein KKI90_17735 [Xenorhabdus bovienii]|uniref:Uncharacterized protein n=3 Tax=Xenorhabdus bovienii TaxID=40576 RepID=A0A077PWH5_XENBV|nr:hypothetical protein [Xenorhabdus bovienii]CDH03324.1 hypothetical protein XBFM1_730002 [Xenorhabdus bovienii str. feltiae Moldova]MDE1488122.1 hypothetical protein [Xenorhabdus bovienii]MDE9479012.1 hypothetical protein [Xenorhabdus bovienii]MDE9532204.1 hypothetical protein [Xenorhabdus bovienii]CDH25041.1 hypothetical protein XBKB1_3560002 [Xenorhabdus bovienii str. kraussei Becker Underwood]